MLKISLSFVEQLHCCTSTDWPRGVLTAGRLLDMHANGGVDQAAGKAGRGNLGLIGPRGSQEVPSVVEET